MASSSTAAAADEEEKEKFFSDESSFYGDDELKEEYEERAASFDVLHYWEHVHPYNLQVLSAKDPQSAAEKSSRDVDDASVDSAEKPPRTNTKQTKAWLREKFKNKKPSSKPDKQDPSSDPTPDPTPDPMSLDPPSSPPRNPYEGEPMAKQLSESLSAFLSRLPPSTTTLTPSTGPYIWIANPHTRNNPLTHNQTAFTTAGTALLTAYTAHKQHLEDQHPTAAPATITRKLKPARDLLEADLIHLAQSHAVTAGKWMLFPAPDKVDAVWAAVATATFEGRLGCAAKVATGVPDEGEEGGKPERLICVYTEDFRDVADVRRVMREMSRLGLVGDGSGAGRACYYKIDAYTYLDIKGGNPYKLKASMYSSRDMLEEGDDG